MLEISFISNDIISEEGISLTGMWYPHIEGRAYYHMSAFLPDGFTAVSEADEITVVNTPQGMVYSFNFPHPLNGINLAAGKYMIRKENFNGTDIYVYFFPEDFSHDIIGYFEDIQRADTYLEYTKKYLDMYGELIGPYPYKRFSVVENVLPTGYSMPTFTLLGGDVMRLPFIVNTSLGHEVLHQWFGNYIYDDFEKGNWIEGLTTYQADQFFEKQKGQGGQYRKKLLIDYQSYVKPGKETQLADFYQRSDFASGAIGYGKGTMLFNMLNNEIGDDAFYRGLRGLIKERAFQESTWEDVRMAFENASGRNLERFFNQWLNRKGVISIGVEDQRVNVLNGVPTTSFKIIQEGEPYEFNLPLKIITDKGELTKTLEIRKENETFEIPSNGTPLELVFDSDYDLMRSLPENEYPPVIARLLGDEKRLIVIPENDDTGKYEDLIRIFEGEGFIPKKETEINDENITTSTLLVLGYDSPVLRRLFGGWKKPDPGFSLAVADNPLNTSKVVAVAYGDSKEEVDLASGKIVHYGQYSFIRFEKGKNVESKTDETDRGIRVSLNEPVLGIQPQKTIKLDDIIRNISNKTIIYVAETHTNYEEHKVQLAVIMNLYEKGSKFAIGMEMFQKPFQKAIDDYIAGNITEKEFLKKTEYFKRWGYDYNLYREIIEFAKAKKIPIVALNQRSEIIDNVSKGGLDILTDEEKKEIPEDMDMSDEIYKNQLQEIFDQHGQGFENFDYFYQSQILWDETMAHSVDEFLKQNPDYHMVVLAGTGHIMYDSGIPKRAYRLNGKDYATLIQNPDSIDENIGNFVLFPKSLSLLPTPQLGIFPSESGGRVKITNVESDSVAEKAGLKKDDLFISIDDWKIETIDDVRISIFDKKQGDTIKVKVLRKSLVGEKELEFTVTL